MKHEIKKITLEFTDVVMTITGKQAKDFLKYIELSRITGFNTITWTIGSPRKKSKNEK